MHAAAAVVGMLAAIFAGFFIFFVSMSRASRRGYQAGTITVVIIVAMLAGGALAFLPLAMDVDIDGGVLAVAAPLCFLLSPAAALAALPRRKPRRIFIVRRVTLPYAAIGQALFVILCLAGVVTSLLLWWTGAPFSLVGPILIAGPALGLQVKYLFTKVLGQPTRGVRSFADVMAADPRPPVVFMRAFERESHPFVFGPLSQYGRYSQRPRMARQQTEVQIALDEYLQRTIERHIGPFLALGNPQDYFTPAGAARAYFKDETWMEEFTSLARGAGCLILEASESSNLRWELQFLRQSNLHERLIAVTGHPTDPYAGFWMQFMARMAGVPRVSWEQFAGMLTELGYDVPTSEPELGSVIGFDAAARGHVLTSDADLPEQFVAPMAAWIAGNRDQAECVEATCTACARRVLKAPHTLADPFICRACRAGSPLRQTVRSLATWIGVALLLPLVIAVLALPTLLGFTADWIHYVWLVIVAFVGLGIYGAMSQE
jgi:hypothetical protein